MVRGCKFFRIIQSLVAVLIVWCGGRTNLYTFPTYLVHTCFAPPLLSHKASKVEIRKRLRYISLISIPLPHSVSLRVISQEYCEWALRLSALSAYFVLHTLVVFLDYSSVHFTRLATAIRKNQITVLQQEDSTTHFCIISSK